jgi:hypothetical protein
MKADGTRSKRPGGLKEPKTNTKDGKRMSSCQATWLNSSLVNRTLSQGEC